MRTIYIKAFRYFRGLFFFILLTFLSNYNSAQDNHQNDWNAKWISHPNIPSNSYAVLHFRKQFTVSDVPAKWNIYVSADNFYRLFVNGVAVCSGPAKGDLKHWYYETVDIAGYLNTGTNTIAVQVCNMGKYAAEAQISSQTAFILQSDNLQSGMVYTDETWKVTLNGAIFPLPVRNGQEVLGGYLAGPTDSLVAGNYPWGWEKPGFDDGLWEAAKLIETTESNNWNLIPSQIPLPEHKKEFIHKIVDSKGDISWPAAFYTSIRGSIEPFQTVNILIDAKKLTTGYPELILSEGKGSIIKIAYAEALYQQKNETGFITALNKDLIKTNRNETANKRFIGPQDVVVHDGGIHRLYRPLNIRTFRYLLLKIETQEQALFIEDYYNMFTAYPFQKIAHFSSADDTLKLIWQTAWHTARLCAQDMYMDCPYYEQLQYVGDTRIQALISCYMSGDDRLMKKAIEQFYYSISDEGLTTMRYPSRRKEFIPPYSLFWICMLHDYYMLRQDHEFLKPFAQGVNSVLDWHLQYADSTSGLLGKMPYWNFVDWTKEWPWIPENKTGGVPKGVENGASSILNLQYLYTLNKAIELFKFYKQDDEVAKYTKAVEKIKHSLYSKYWDDQKQLIADDYPHTEYSQHANAFAVLTDVVPDSIQADFIESVAFDSSLIQCSVYYRFYLHEALKKAGRQELFLDLLGPWKNMLNKGLTSFAEKEDPSRSDCHAWSAHPIIDMLSSVAGIKSLQPGFKHVSISPGFGHLNFYSAKMPHPNGIIDIKFKKVNNSHIIGTVTLPGEITGELNWGGKVIPLNPGYQTVHIKVD